MRFRFITMLFLFGIAAAYFSREVRLNDDFRKERTRVMALVRSKPEYRFLHVGKDVVTDGLYISGTLHSKADLDGINGELDRLSLRFTERKLVVGEPHTRAGEAAGK